MPDNRFNVNLYTFTKKENSTARPSGSGRLFTCILRRGSSAMVPTLEFNVGQQGNPTAYNYCYIEEFSRYYFIQDWAFMDGIWTARCEVDVLATYKTTIGGTSLYMLRASAAYDGRIVDEMYPTKTGCTFNRTTQTTPWSLSAGSFCLGVVNESPTIGSLCYYMASVSDMRQICNALLNDDNDGLWTANGFNTSDASLALQKSIIDPIQYIKSAIYLPFAFPSTGYSVQPFKMGCMTLDRGPLPITMNLQVISASNSNLEFTRTFSLVNHPQTTARGAYMNSAPYTLRTLMFPPFGVIELDTSVLANASTLEASVRVDLPTGLGVLTLESNGIILNRLEAQVGVPVQVSQISRDYVGGITSILSAVTGMVSTGIGLAAAPVTGGASAAMALGGVSGAASNIGNAVKALSPRSQSVGSGGSYAQLVTVPRVESQFFEAVQDDNAHNGRPYCQIATPSSLGGYMLVQDGDVPINGTGEEAARVRMYLESGFYYE